MFCTQSNFIDITFRYIAIKMDASSSSNDNNWSLQHWEESINQLPDSDASDTDDDDECNFQGIRLELENILVCMAMILK
jgi:hypothetical protein